MTPDSTSPREPALHLAEDFGAGADHDADAPSEQCEPQDGLDDEADEPGFDDEFDDDDERDGGVEGADGAEGAEGADDSGSHPRSEAATGGAPRTIARLADWGEHLPGAAKDAAVGRQPSDDDDTDLRVKLRALWPQPDWHALIIAKRLQPQVACLHYLRYGSLLQTSSRARFGLSTSEWARAYAQAVPLVRRTMNALDTPERAAMFAAALGHYLYRLTPRELSKRPVSEHPLYWAMSRGERVLHSPGLLTTPRARLAAVLVACGWPSQTWALKTGIIPIPGRTGAGTSWFVARTRGDLAEPIAGLGPYPELRAAVASAQAQAAEEIRLQKLSTRAARIARVQRRGPPQRDEGWSAEVLRERFGRDFGLRAIQFGSSLPAVEQAASVAYAYDALADLADVTGLPRRWMGLAGRGFRGLGVAFAARGRKGAVAHYEPGLQVTNFTRRRGAGSLAHEWAHGLDHRLAAPMFTSYVEHVGAITPVSPIEQGVHRVMQVLRRMFNTGAGASGYAWQARRMRAVRGVPPTWTSPPELFARAFEAWVEDRLVAMDRTSPWLVSSTAAPGEERKAASWPYPVGEDRRRIAVVFDELMRVLRSG